MTSVEKGFVLTALLGGLWTGVALLYSQAARRSVRPLAFYAASAIVACPVAWVAVVNWSALAEGLPQSPLPLVILMAGAGAANVGLQLLLLHTIGIGHRSTVWTICQSALVVPFLFAGLWWKEPIGFIEGGGVAAVLAGVALLGLVPAAKTSTNNRWQAYAILCFCGVGCMHIANIIPSHEALFHDYARLRTPIMLTAYFVTVASLALGQKMLPTKSEWVYGGAYGLIVVAAAITMYAALDLLAETHRAGLVFPLAVGLSIVGFLLLDSRQSGGPSKWRAVLVLVLVLGGITAIAVSQLR